MKRHPSLVHLSREHHGSLILARLLQKDAPVYKGLPVNAEGKAVYALKIYKEELIQHFKAEEKILKLVTGMNADLDLLVKAISREHQELHVLFKAISNHPDLSTHLDELGKALEIHVRKEERELFPLIQETCSEDMMKTIELALASN